MTPEFTRALTFVLRWEGGWSDNAADPGGATMKGITLATFTAWRAAQYQSAPTKADLKAISDDEVTAIYWYWYWLKAGCDSLAWPLSLAHFDLAVNGGVGRAAEAMQAAPVFLRYMAWRIEWYTRLSTWATFGAGWTRRCADLLKEAAK